MSSNIATIREGLLDSRGMLVPNTMSERTYLGLVALDKLDKELVQLRKALAAYRSALLSREHETEKLRDLLPKGYL